MLDKIKDIFLGTPNGDSMRALLSSFIVMFSMLIIAIIATILSRKTDPLKRPKGFLFLFELGLKTFDGMVDELMGPRFKGFGGFIYAIALYIGLSFLIGLTGLTAPLTNLAMPLSLGLITFVLIHATAVRFNKIRYFKRYVEPIPVFLPINLLSMWAPLLSLTFRLFGNALSGWTLMSVVYFALESASQALFGFLGEGVSQIILAPFIAPALHAYFDLFSGLIQTIVFIMLTMLFISNEQPEDDEMEQKLTV